jgi:hypothetical protein
MANVATRVPAVGTTTIPSSTLAIFACTFDSSLQTLTITNGTDYTFRDTSGVLVVPVAALWSYTVTPTVNTALHCLVITAASVIIRTLAATTLHADSNGTLFLFGPGSRKLT